MGAEVVGHPDPGQDLAPVVEPADKKHVSAPESARVQELDITVRLINEADTLALAWSRSHPPADVLRRLAFVERLLGHHDVSLGVLDHLSDIDNEDLDTMVDQAETLAEMRCYRTAIILLDSLRSPEVGRLRS